MQKTDFYFKSAARGAHLAEFWRIARNRMGLREIFFYFLMEKSLPKKTTILVDFYLTSPKTRRRMRA